MEKVRIGIVGIGNMGTSHVERFTDGLIKNGELSAVCDIRKSRQCWAQDNLESVCVFSDYDDMLKSDKVDAVLISTPHYMHPEMAEKALLAGKHVLVEKPVGVYTKRVRKLNELAKKSDKVFAIMYNQRTHPAYQKVRQLIKNGDLGELVRINWVITDWFRTQYYYDSAGWRATWQGEGGGVLMNQACHQLDLLQWMCGMPKKVRGFCGYGKFHDIEVEDDVTAYFEYENGATGTFVTSTGESPGTNRLEISGDKGKVVIEPNRMIHYRNLTPTSVQCTSVQQGFRKPKVQIEETVINDKGLEHVGIIQNFVDCIMCGNEMIAPGIEGINGLTLSNAIHLSSWTDDWVKIPFDEDKYYDFLQMKIENSDVKKEEKDMIIDLTGSH